MLVCVSLHNLARETAGAARTRLSLRPLFSGGPERTGQTSRETCGEIAKAYPAVIASAAKQSSFLAAARWIASLRSQ